MTQAEFRTKRLWGYTIVMPLNVPLEFPSDYIKQTASVLRKRNTVVFFDFRSPISIFTLLRNNYQIRQVARGIRKIYSNQRKGDIFFRPLAILPFQRFQFIHTLNIHLGIFELRWLLAISRRKRVILWGFHPLTAHIIGKLREIFSIYDCVDYYGQEIIEGRYLQKLENKLMRSVSLISFNSRALYIVKTKEYDLNSAKSIIGPCGCNTALFTKQKNHNFLDTIPKPRIGFVGHLNYRVHYRLLNRLIRYNPQWSFVFVGPVWEKQLEDRIVQVTREVNSLHEYSNVYYLGEKPKNLIPDIISQMDVCIIPYNTNFRSVRYCNPMKAYEYLACGKPIVSTRLPALQEIEQSVIKMTNNAEEFAFSINYFLKNWNDKMTEIAVGLARKHSWLKKLRPIELRILNQTQQIQATKKIKVQ